MKTEKITRPSQLRDGDRVNFGSWKNCRIVKNGNLVKVCLIEKLSHFQVLCLDYSFKDEFLIDCWKIERIIKEPKTTIEPINDNTVDLTINIKEIRNQPINEAIESINVDFKNNVVTTVYAGESNIKSAADGLSTMLKEWDHDEEYKKLKKKFDKEMSTIKEKKELNEKCESSIERLNTPFSKPTNIGKLFIDLGLKLTPSAKNTLKLMRDFDRQMAEVKAMTQVLNTTANQSKTDFEKLSKAMAEVCATPIEKFDLKKIVKKSFKDRYFTDGFTIAKNPHIDKDKIVFESHICLNVYSKGGWLPINEYTTNWCKASKKQRKEYKRVESCQ